MIGYKGFDKNFCCQDFQFEVGETYKYNGELKICERGFHFCLNPLAVFRFYPPTNGNRYALVEVTGKIIEADNDSHKAVTDEIKIVKELSLDELIATVPKKDTATNTGNYSVATNTGNYSVVANTGNCSVVANTGNYSVVANTGNCSVTANTGYQSAATNAGYRSAATNAGYRSAATNTGNCSAATTTGDCSAAIVSGKESVALVTGKDSKAKGALGCWLVLGEWDSHSLIDVQVFKVDGKKILPDTFYRLKDGKPVAVDD